MTALVVRGGTLLTMDPQRRILEADLRIEAGRISAVGPALPHDPAADEVDARGLVVLPGFIQGHVHLGQSLFRGLAEGRELLDWLRERIWPLEAAHDHESAYWSAVLGIADALLSGTTTVHEIGLVHSMQAVFEAIRDTGIRAVAGKCLMDRGQGVPAPLLEDTAAALAETRELHRRWHDADDGRIRYALCPRFILSCSDRLWEGTAALARELALPVHTHLLEHPREEIETVRTLGVTQLEFLEARGILDTRLCIAHGVQIGPEHLTHLRGRPLGVCHCPSANLKLGSGIADLGLLRRTPAIAVGIGCDGAACNNDMDILEEMRLAALLQQYRQGPGAFEAIHALELATIDGARAIGREADLGSLEVGKAGDLVLLDLGRPATFGPASSLYDRIVYAAGRDAVHSVVVAGRVLVERGELRTIDVEALGRRPAEALSRLLARAELP